MKVAYSISRKGSRRYDFLKPFDRELVVRSGLSLRHVSPFLFTTVIIILYYILCRLLFFSVIVVVVVLILLLFQLSLHYTDVL